MCMLSIQEALGTPTQTPSVSMTLNRRSCPAHFTDGHSDGHGAAVVTGHTMTL